MKKLNKILLSFVAVFALAILLKLPVDAAAKQTGCTSTSITIQIDEPGSTIVGYYYSTDYMAPSQVDYIPTAPTRDKYSFTISNLSNVKTNLYIYYKYYNSYNDLYGARIQTSVNTLPLTPASNNLAVDSVLYNTKKVSFKVSQNDAATGFEIELYKNGTLASRQSFSSSYSTYFPVSANATYQYRVRYYTKNSSNGQTYYSANWSPMRKFCLPTFSGKAKSNRKGFTLTLKKASGVKKYYIYVSKSSSTKGFKKVASVSLGSKKKKTISITKKYKKKARNYIRVVPVFADGTKSDIIGTGSIYVYK